MPYPLRQSLSKVTAVGLDVDGVLTDGSRVLNEQGRAFITFHARDGLGIIMLKSAGIEVAFVSVVDSPIVEARARELGIEDVRLGNRDKLLWAEEKLSGLNGLLMFVGDDLWDLPAMRASHIAAAVSDAVPEVLAAADIVSAYPGGKGAVRQVADLILASKGIDREQLVRHLVPLVTLGDMSINDVAPVFERINSTGTRLTIYDLMRAATWSPEFDLGKTIDSIKRSLTGKKFQELDNKTFLRALAAAAGNDFSSASIDALRDLDRDQLIKAADETKEAADRAADFLATEIRAPRADALPYANQFAFLFAAGEPYRGGKWLTAWVSLAVSCTAAAALWPIINLTTGEIERLFLATSLPGIQWRWLALPYPATALLLGVRLRLPRTRTLLAPLAVPACAALIGTTLFLPHSLVRRSAGQDIVLRVGIERWWLCTLIGWIVLAVLALSGGVPGLARAWVSAWLATLLAGAELIIYGTFHGHRPGLAAISLAVATPSVWLFYLGIPTACLALLRIRLPGALRPPWLAPIGASMGAAAIALTVVGLASPLESLTMGNPPPSAAPTPPGQLLVPADPGRVLTAAAARLVISHVSAALSPLWASQASGTAGAASTHGSHPPAINPAVCEPLARSGFVRTLPRALAGATGQYKAVPDVIPVGSANLDIFIYSYARPVTVAMFTAANQDLQACHHYTVTTLNATLAYTVHDVAPPHIGNLSWQVDYSVVYKQARTSLTWIYAAIGHNLIVLTQQTVALGTLLPLQQTAINAALNAATYGLSHTPGH